MSKILKPKRGWKNSGTFTPYYYAGIPSFYKSTSKKLRKKYFKAELDNRDATIEDFTDEGIHAFQKFYDDSFQKMANILSLYEISDKLKNLLEDAMQEYLIDKDRIPKTPRLSEVKATLTEIHDKTKSLIRDLERIDDKTLDALAMTSYPENASDLNFFYDLPFNKKMDIHKIYFASKEALSELEKDKGGRPANIPLRNVIFELKAIYEKFVGRKATITWDEYEDIYRGQFYDLVHTYLTVIGPEYTRNNNLLGTHIKRALRYAKKINVK